MHLVGFTIEIYYDARSYKRKKKNSKGNKMKMYTNINIKCIRTNAKVWYSYMSQRFKIYTNINYWGKNELLPVGWCAVRRGFSWQITIRENLLCYGLYDQLFLSFVFVFLAREDTFRSGFVLTKPIVGLWPQLVQFKLQLRVHFKSLVSAFSVVIPWCFCQ